jgi:FdhE protein
MKKPGAPEPDPSAIGIIPKPPFVRLPEPAALFAGRAARFRSLAEGHELGSYLRFLAELTDVQAALVAGPEPELPDAEALDRAERHAMPPLDRAGTAAAALDGLLDGLLDRARGIEMPPPARAALDRVTAAGAGERAAMVADVLADAVAFEAIAEHVLVAAALQVRFARLASRLDAARLKPVGDGACPACGGPPVASLVVGWARPEGVRYCACSLCGTLWNYVRAKCTLCASTAEVSLRSVAGGDAAVKAECCGTCRGYVKVLYQQGRPELDPVADDVASLGLDLLVREQGFRRGAVNPFLTGY